MFESFQIAGTIPEARDALKIVALFDIYFISLYLFIPFKVSRISYKKFLLLKSTT